jgi:ABC-2 type transport system ATP-binding protein
MAQTSTNMTADTSAPVPPSAATAAAGAPRAADAEAVIQCAGLTKIFRDFWMRNRVRAVDALDLIVRRGEVYGLLGPNGSGKSTTIKMILGLLHPTAGRVAVLGKRPDDVNTKRLIGYLPEESYLYRFLTARETLDYYGRLFHQDRRQRQKRIDMLLEMVGLEAVQRRPVGEFSKGMQRRIGLAQALINDPVLLILDEPTAGLDPIGTRQFKDLILELRQRGKTVLLCSHLLADVEDVCDRLSIMFGGRIRVEGTVDQLLTRRDMTAIETGNLDEKVIAEIERVLERHGSHVQRVDRPRQKLESLFLDIVQRAQAEGAATSGAVAGGRIAAFLVDEAAGRDAGEPDDGAEARRLLDELTAAPQSMPPARGGQPTAPSPSAPSPRREVLDELVTPESPPSTNSPPPAAPTPTSTNTAAEEVDRRAKQQQVDRDLLDRLTRGDQE